MVFDTVMAAGVVIVVLSCIMITYVSIFAYKHIKQDSLKADKARK